MNLKEETIITSDEEIERENEDANSEISFSEESESEQEKADNFEDFEPNFENEVLNDNLDYDFSDDDLPEEISTHQKEPTKTTVSKEVIKKSTRIIFEKNEGDASISNDEEQLDETSEQEIITESKSEEFETNIGLGKKRKCPWRDEETENITYEDQMENYSGTTLSQRYKGGGGIKLQDIARETFLECNPTPKWADDSDSDSEKKKRDDEDSSDDDEEDESNLEITSRASKHKAKSLALPSSMLRFKRCKDLNFGNRPNRRVQVVKFHPTARVALVASESGQVDFFEVDGKENKHIQGVKFGNCSLQSIKFTPDGHKVLATTRNRNYLLCYDLEADKIFNIPGPKQNNEWDLRNIEICRNTNKILVSGNKGSNFLLSGTNYELIRTFTQCEKVNASQFSNDGSKLYTFGEGSHVYIWDVDSGLCLHRFVDQGTFNGTSIALSPNEELFATGSVTGLVNIYDASSLMSPNPTIIKSFTNMKSPIDRLKFNSTSEILAMASTLDKDSLKMVHFPEKTMFMNFPNSKITCPYSFDFSLNSGYFAAGLKTGVAKLFRLKHYTDY